MARLLLNGIVKNEASRIERMLASVAPHIVGYAIVDTGSTDDTQERIGRFFQERDIPGVISQAPFHDWSQARNAALDLARGVELAYDYILLVDADMELVVVNPRAFQGLAFPAYQMLQIAGVLKYKNTRLVARGLDFRYRGVTHEYVDCGPVEDITGAHFIDHADGANRPNKFKRDIYLLQKDLRTDPTNVRSLFYIANSYRDDGQHRLAVKAFDQRILAGGWDQEVWNAMYERAKCHKELKEEAKFVQGMLEAYSFRPTRAEPLYELATHYRHKGKNDLACLFAARALQVPLSTDELFVNTHAYNYGPKEELAIAGFYSKLPEEKERAFTLCNELALDPAAPKVTRDQADRNMFFYLKRLTDYCPSFEAKQIKIQTPDGYVAMNPSVAVKHTSTDELWAVVRTVNYLMDEAGRYLIRHTETGEITNDNPIHTRNFLVRFNTDLSVGHSKEIHMPMDWPNPKYLLVRAFEDMRLNFRGDNAYVNACVREQNVDGWCEQYEARITHIDATPYGTVGYQYGMADWHGLFHGPARQHEKNWAPIAGNFLYQYRLGTVVDGRGGTICEHKIPGPIHAMSGSSQVIPFNGGYLTLMHEARYNPHDGKRYYQHRFVFIDHEFFPRVVSDPFVFHEREIEFAAGLAALGDKLVISYGRRDCEAWLATVHRDDVRKMLHVNAG